MASGPGRHGRRLVHPHRSTSSRRARTSIDLVQLSGAPGEREMCGTKSGVHSAADFKGKTLGVTDLGSGTDELTQFLAAQKGITSKRLPHARRRRRRHRDRRHPARHRADCVMTTQPTVGALETKKLAYSAVDLATTDGRPGGARRRLAGGRRARPRRLGERPTRTRPRRSSTRSWPPCTGSTRTARPTSRTSCRADFVQNSTITKDQYIAGADDRQGPVPAGRHHARRRPEDRLRDGEADRRRHVEGDPRATRSPTSTPTRRTSSRASPPPRRRPAPTADLLQRLIWSRTRGRLCSPTAVRGPVPPPAADCPVTVVIAGNGVRRGLACAPCNISCWCSASSSSFSAC